MLIERLDKLERYLHPGCIYRRADLVPCSKSANGNPARKKAKTLNAIDTRGV